MNARLVQLVRFELKNITMLIASSGKVSGSLKFIDDGGRSAPSPRIRLRQLVQCICSTQIQIAYDFGGELNTREARHKKGDMGTTLFIATDG